MCADIIIVSALAGALVFLWRLSLARKPPKKQKLTVQRGTLGVNVKTAKQVLFSAWRFRPEPLLFVFVNLKAHSEQGSIHHDYASMIMRRGGINIHLFLAFRGDSEM